METISAGTFRDIALPAGMRITVRALGSGAADVMLGNLAPGAGPDDFTALGTANGVPQTFGTYFADRVIRVFARHADAEYVVALNPSIPILPGAVTIQSAVARAFTPQDSGAYVRYAVAGAKTGTFAVAAGFTSGDEITISNRASADNLTLSGTGITLNAPAAGTLVLAPGMTVVVKFVSATAADVYGQTVVAV